MAEQDQRNADGATPEQHQGDAGSAEHEGSGGLDARELRPDDDRVPVESQEEARRWLDRVDPVERGGATSPG